MHLFPSLVEIRYDPKENSFQNAFLKFLAGEKLPSLEALANESIIRKPKDNIYIGSVNAGIVLSSLGQPTGSMGYQTYMVNDESRIEEIMVIGRPLYDDSKGVKINPLLKNIPTNVNNNNQAYLPQTITLTPNSSLFRNDQNVRRNKDLDSLKRTIFLGDNYITSRDNQSNQCRYIDSHTSSQWNRRY